MTKYDALSTYIITNNVDGFESKNNIDTAGIRIVEIVKPNISLIGSGTQSDPWMFTKERTQPIITLSSNSNTTYAKSQSVVVTVSDNGSGLEVNQKLKYGWSESKTIEPSSYTNVVLDNNSGDESAIFTISNSSLTGKYYLWVVPDTNVCDLYSNCNTTPVISTGLFYFDNTAPTCNIEAQSIVAYFTTDNIKITISSSDGESGLASTNAYGYKYGSQIDYTLSSNSSYTFYNITRGAYTAYGYVVYKLGNYDTCSISVTNTYQVLTDVILRDNTAYADNVSSPCVTSPTGINFANISSDTNGKGLYYTTDTSKTENGTRVYYYRGAVENNYVIFANKCWKIIRTNEDGSVKLFYWGEPLNNTCSTTAIVPTSFENIRFNSTYGDNAYVGYMMGIANECSGSIQCAGTTRTATIAQAHTNTYSSIIKTAIDSWYQTNINNQGTNVTNLIANTIYCNDRSVTSGNGFGASETDYGAKTRLNLNANPQYKCQQSSDKFSLSVASGGTLGFGNNALTYPVGLITADEVSYAGGTLDENNSYYLYTNGYYWTMSPSTFVFEWASICSINSHGSLSMGTRVDNYYGFNAYPSISLIYNAYVISGTGVNTEPYFIKTN